MLVLVTLFISVSDSLPKTSYIKMMDYWLIFNLILPFIEVLLHTYMESLNEDGDTDTINEKEIEKVRLYHFEIEIFHADKIRILLKYSVYLFVCF